ncbi:MucBP domain-containing protein [Lactococcus garvieae]|uniref:MucBP domain-containing protein n=1 Tax=Lactococcus garvieae TaxID=1363 RepID=UPI00385404D9
MIKKILIHLFWVNTTLLVISGSSCTLQAKANESLATVKVSDAASQVASGLNGDSQWTLSREGVLRIGEGVIKEDICSNLNRVNENYSSFVTKVIFTGRVISENISDIFSMLPSVEEIEGLENLDISKLRVMNMMFYNTPKLKKLNLNFFSTEHAYSMQSMFADAVELEYLDLSSFHMRGGVITSRMFEGTSHLKTIVLGENFYFKGNSVLSQDIGLPNITPTNEYTGYWQDLGDEGTPEHPKGAHIFTSAQLVEEYDGETMAGTFVWQPNTLYGGADLTAQTSAIGQANATAPLETELEDPFGKKVNVIATLTDDTGAEVQNGHLEKGKYTVTYRGTTTNGQTATVTHALIVTDPGAPVVQGGNTTVQYVDESGQSISPAAILKGNVGDAITPSQKSISGYTYKSTTWPDTSHKFTAKTQTVKVIYRKNTTPTPVTGGKVTVQYVDTAGKSISSDATLKGNVGDAITPSQKSISGYTYKSTTWPDTSHKFTAKTQTVKVIYRKNTTPAPTTQRPISVYRLYNKKSMEHLYTKDANEYNNLPKMSKDWVREGVNFKAYAKADSTTQAVYRVYNPKSGEHIYTTDSNEVKVLTTQCGWKNAGVAWHSPKSGKEVYRFFNPKTGLGAHFVTADANERKVLTTKPNEWKYEGIAWHSIK